jgi:thioredoxin-related protein
MGSTVLDRAQRMNKRRTFMMQSRFTGLALLVALALPVMPAHAGGATKFANFDAAKQAAAAHKQLVLLEFGAEWCGPCQRFARDATTQPALQQALSGVAYHAVDAEKGEGLPLAKEYTVKGYPTFVLMDATGASIDRWTGYLDSKDFIATFTDATADPTTVEAKRARLAQTPKAADAARLGRIEASAWQLPEAVQHYEQAMKLDPKGGALYAFPRFETYAQGFFKGEVFSAGDVDKAATTALAAAGVTPDQQIQIASIMSGVGTKSENPKIAVPYLKSAMAATADSKDPQIVEQRRELLVDHAMYVEENPTLAARYKREAMPEGWMEDPVKLNQYAWWCFENKTNLEEAETLARRGVELAKSGSQKAMVLDTAAEICNLRGSCKDAAELMEQALREDPKNEYYTKQLDRFRKLLAAKN